MGSPRRASSIASHAASSIPSIAGSLAPREDEPEVLERWTLTLTDTQLERRFIPIARRVGLGDPLTRQWLNGCRVDFFFSDLGIVVEADGPRYYRTAARQTADARRDQRHAAAGLTPLRFSHAQITYHPDEVEDVLRRVAARIRLASGDQA